MSKLGMAILDPDDRTTYSARKMQRIALALAGLMGALSVGAGAAARHLLPAASGPAQLGYALLAVRFGILHAAVLVGLAALLGGDSPLNRRRWLVVACWCFFGGFLGFCVGLWILALGASPSWGRAVPVGGMLFIAGWLALVGAALSPRRAL
jgi:uncharacterized membrane protein YgdD (TMEM256/DUF423 family)